MRISRQPRGVVALVTVLIVMVVLLSIGLTISAIGQDEIILARVVQDGENAFAVADACVEEGLQRLKTDGSYAGSAFTLDGGDCVVSVTNLGGNDRLVRGQGTYGREIRIIDANVSLKFNTAGNAKKVTINSWTEAN